MSLFWIIVLSVVGVAVLLFLFQRNAFKRMGSAIKGQVSKVTRSLWSADPIAVYQAEVDEAAEQVASATNDLQNYKAHLSELSRKKINRQAEIDKLSARIRQNLLDGKEDRAADCAVQLKQSEKELEVVNKSLSAYEASYETSKKKIQYARKKIEDARENARKLNVDLEMSKAEAKLADLAESFNVDTNKLDGLGEVSSEIQRQIDQNRARAEVIRDLNVNSLEDIEEEERMKKAEAQDVLARFKQEMGTKS